jgi:hypothetical protein
MSVAGVSRITTTPPMMRRAGDVQVAKAPGSGLVTLTPQVQTTSGALNRPDPSFVAHLIATAEHAPQTRILRRAAIADVQAAYRSAANQNEMATAVAGQRMRLSA